MFSEGYLVIPFYFICCWLLLVIFCFYPNKSYYSGDGFLLKSLASICFLIGPLSMIVTDSIQKLPAYTWFPKNLTLQVNFFDVLGVLFIGAILSVRNATEKAIYLTLIFILIILFGILEFVQPINPLYFYSVEKIISLSMVVVFSAVSLRFFPFYQGGDKTMKNEKVFRVIFLIGLLFWLIIIFHGPYLSLAYDKKIDLYNFWFSYKIILLFAIFQYSLFKSELCKNKIISSTIDSLQNLISKVELTEKALNHLSVFLFVVSEKGKIIFGNIFSKKELGLTSVQSIHFDSIFFDSMNKAMIDKKVSYKKRDNSLQMYSVKTEKIDDNYCLWMLKPIDFDFESFCQSILKKEGGNKITGLLDHNFAIYRMSPGWKQLMKSIDNFFHSGVIWDKLRILSENVNEILHIENEITHKKKVTGWLEIRSGNGIVVTLEKMTSPGQRYFYYFHGEYLFKNKER